MVKLIRCLLFHSGVKTYTRYHKAIGYYGGTTDIKQTQHCLKCSQRLPFKRKGPRRGNSGDS